MSNLSEQIKMMAIQQSVDEISNTLGDLQGIKNALLAGTPKDQTRGRQLQDILTHMEKEVTHLTYVTSQGHVPKSQQEINLGLKVQEAIHDISQI